MRSLFVGSFISNLGSESHVGTLAYFSLMTIRSLLGSHWIATMGHQTQGACGMTHLCCWLWFCILFDPFMHLIISQFLRRSMKWQERPLITNHSSEEAPCYNRCFWKCNLWPITSGPAKCPLRKLVFIFCPLHIIFKSLNVFSKMKIVGFALRGEKYVLKELKAGIYGVTFTFFGQNYVHHWAFYNCSQSFEIRLQEQ